MPRHVMKCRVCGAEYEACTSIKAGGPFNWREVACSPECGEIYLSRVNEARGKKKAEPVEEMEVREEKEFVHSPIVTFQRTIPETTAQDEADTLEYE